MKRAPEPEQRADPPLPPSGEGQAFIGPWKVYAGLLTALIVAAWLTTFRLVQVAESLSPGPARTVGVALTSAYHSVARHSGLAMPSEIAYRQLGRPSTYDSSRTEARWRQIPDESAIQSASASDAAERSDDPDGYVDNDLASAPVRQATPTDSPARGTDTSDLDADSSIEPKERRVAPARGSAVVDEAYTVAGDARSRDEAPADVEATSQMQAAPADTESLGNAEPANATGRRVRWPAATSTTGAGVSRAPIGPGKRQDDAGASSTRLNAAPGRPASGAGGRSQRRDRPIGVLVAGDSMAEPLGYELAEHASADGLIDVGVDFKISSGLARPDYYDWWERLEDVMGGPNAPQTVVWFSGGNDNQPLQAADGIASTGAPEWRAEYARRAGALMDTVLLGGATMIWVTLPPIRDPDHHQAASDMNKAATAEAARRRGVRIVSLQQMFDGPNGVFAPYLPGPDGRTVRVRQEDGVHLTTEGTQWVADLVYGQILADAGLERPTRP